MCSLMLHNTKLRKYLPVYRPSRDSKHTDLVETSFENYMPDMTFTLQPRDFWGFFS